MSKGNSGLFSGTYSSTNGKRITKQDTIYFATEALRDHIENPQPSSSGSSGIKGAHNKDNFLNEMSRIGAKKISTTQNSQLDGVEQIKYKMPQKDKHGNPTGNFKAKEFSKTVYDPLKISTNEYLTWGLQTANNTVKQSAFGKLNREWSGTDNQGVKWHGYCDSNGNITSFYPED